SRQRRSDLARPAPAADTTVELRDHRARIVVSALHRCVEFLPPQTGLPWPTCRRRLGHRVLCCRGETTTGWALRLPLPAGSAEEDLRLFQRCRGTDLRLSTADDISAETISVPLRLAILPQWPYWTRSAAAIPSRVDSTRS